MRGERLLATLADEGALARGVGLVAGLGLAASTLVAFYGPTLLGQEPQPDVGEGAAVLGLAGVGAVIAVAEFLRPSQPERLWNAYRHAVAPGARRAGVVARP